MSNASFQIPLLDLPERGMKRVLQQIEFYHLLRFSYLSRQSRDAVATLKHLHPDKIVIEISNCITIHCLRNENGRLRRTSIGIFKKPCGITPDTTVLPIPVLVEVFRDFGGRGISFPGRKENFCLKQYLEHFLAIFKCKNIQVCFNSQRDVFPVEPLYEAFENVGIGSLAIKTRVSEQLIKRFLPRTDVYEIGHEHPFNKQSLRKILIQNLTKLELQAVNPQFSITLDDLLMTNSSHIMIKTTFNEKDLNTFFRCWQLGSNPRLKYINIKFVTPREMDKERALKRTQCQQRPRNNSSMILYRIQRIGGITAEIKFRRDNHGVSMFVMD